MEIKNAVIGFSSRQHAAGDIDALQSVGTSHHRYLGTSPNGIRYYAVAYAIIPDWDINRKTKTFLKADISGHEAYIELGDAATAKVANYIRGNDEK